MAKEDTNKQRLLSIMAVAIVFIFAAFLILSSEYNSTGHVVADENQQYIPVDTEVDYSNEYSASSEQSVYLTSEQTSGFGPEYNANYDNVISTPGIKNQGSSVLLYPYYISNAANTGIKNTQIDITNNHLTKDVTVHFYYVEGSSCSVADFKTYLTPQQTETLYVSDFDPDRTGYIIAIAEDSSGKPMNFNYLAGNEYFWDSTNQDMSSSGAVTAVGFDAIAQDPLAGQNFASGKAILKFDGVNYAYPAGLCRLQNIPSRAAGLRMTLVINAFGGSLLTGANSVGSGESSIFGLLYDDQEQSQSFTFTAGCQSVNVLSDTYPRTVPRFTTVVSAGRTGWMEMWTSNPSVGLYGITTQWSTLGQVGPRGSELLDCIPMDGKTVTLTVPVFNGGE